MKNFAKPDPLALVTAYSLLNKNAYDKELVLYTLEKSYNKLQNSFIPSAKLNGFIESQSGFALQSLKATTSTKLYPQFYQKSNWGELICPNVYAIALSNNEFYNELNPKQKEYIAKNAQIMIMWTKQTSVSYSQKESISKIEEHLGKSNEEKSEINLERHFLPVTISYRDFMLLSLGMKAKESSISAYEIKNILQSDTMSVFNEDEKAVLSRALVQSYSYINHVTAIMDDKELLPFIASKMGMGHQYKLNHISASLLVHEICCETSLGNILSNITNNRQALTEYLQEDVKRLEIVFPLLWDRFTDKSMSGLDNNFNENPTRLFVMLHKMGFSTDSLKTVDEQSNYYLSHFLLNKAEDKLMDALTEKGFYTKEWFINNFNDTKWQTILNEQNTSLFYISRHHLDCSIFDLAPPKYHSQLLDVMINKCSDFDINFAIQSDNFNVNNFNQVMKIGKGKGTYLHKLLIKNYLNSLQTALVKGADYKIPVENDIISYMTKNQKYDKLLTTLKPLILYNDLQNRVPEKPTGLAKKIKI